MNDNESNVENEYDELIGTIFERLEEGYSSSSPLGSAMPTGFDEIDSICSGFIPGDLIILGGLPSIGKSALAFNICSNLIFGNNKSVYILSSEARPDRLLERFISAESKVPIEQFRSSAIHNEEWAKLAAAAKRFANLNELRIGDFKSFELSEVISSVERENKERKIDFLLIDGIQNIRVPEAETKAVEIAEVSRTLKAIAINHNSCVVSAGGNGLGACN